MGVLKSSKSPVRKITHSVASKWRSCQRRWYYRYVGQLGSPVGMPLLFGSLMHSLFEDEAKLNIAIQMEGLEIGEGVAQTRREDIEAYVGQRLISLNHYFSSFRQEAIAPLQVLRSFMDTAPKYTEEDVEEKIELAKGMFSNWLRLHGADDLERYEFIAAETYFENLPLPKPNDKTQRGWRLAGMIDQLLKDRTTGEYILREIKTTGSDASHYERRVALDPQVRIYAMACEMSGITNDVSVDCVQYVVLRKAMPRNPRALKCKKCKGKGIAKAKFAESEMYDVGEGALIEIREPKIKESTCPSCHGAKTVPSIDKRVDTTQETLLSYLFQRGFAELCDEEKEHREEWPKFSFKENHCHIHPNYFELVSNMRGWDRFISVTTHWLQEEDKWETMDELWRTTQEIADATRRHDGGESYTTCFPRNVNQCGGPAGFCEFFVLCVNRQSVDQVSGVGVWKRNVPDHPELEQQKQKR